MIMLHQEMTAKTTLTEKKIKAVLVFPPSLSF